MRTIKLKFIWLILPTAIVICCLALYFTRTITAGFEDTSSTTPTHTPTPNPTPAFDISKAPTAANKTTTCSNSNDMISVCMAFDNCCAGTSTNANSKCFCSHPFVSGCNDAYKACLAGGGAASECEDKLKACCKSYSSIDIMSSNFQKPINAAQSSNQLCTMNGLPNMEQRCMEVCQTNPACKAYSLTIGGCTLYDAVNNTTSRKGDEYIYVAKK